jgi:hypothetical protein
VVQRLVATIDGLGLRVLVDDPAMSAARARGLILGALAMELGTVAGAFDRNGGT